MSGAGEEHNLNLHATAVALNGRGLLITGQSGSGKSSLALDLMALGADLIADDRVLLERSETGILLSCPPAIQNMIEARGVGILNAQSVSDTALALVVDMDKVEEDRLPPRRTTEVLGLTFELLHCVASPSFPAAVVQYLKKGRKD